jgi:vacuolar-type H+-ATPase subunit E/Vma4
VALPDLIARLEDDVERQIETIAQHADAEVRAINDAASQAAAAASASHLARHRAERELAHRRDLARTRRRAHARELEAQRALIDRILDRARAHLQDDAGSPRHQAALSTHLAEALSYLEGLRARVRCSALQAALLRPLVARHPDVELIIDDSVGSGLVAEAADGSVVVDNTLAARLCRIERRLAIELIAEVGRVRR